MRVSFMTDQGITRSQNQDACYVSLEPIGSLPNLFIVADGMGGHNAGDYASKRAIDSVVAVIEQTTEDVVPAIHQGITIANKNVFDESLKDAAKAGMGTTMVVATIADMSMKVANVGDSRLYVARGSQLQQVTVDHSVIEEMVRKGEITAAEAKVHPKRNYITRAVGAEESVRIDFFDVNLCADDVVLLCSDGLTKMLSDEDILGVLMSEDEVEHKAKELIRLANEAGGIDNITVGLIEV